MSKNFFIFSYWELAPKAWLSMRIRRDSHKMIPNPQHCAVCVQVSQPAALAAASERNGGESSRLDISDQLHQIMEQKMSVFSAKKVEKTSQEQLQMKAAILASYSQVG